MEKNFPNVETHIQINGNCSILLNGIIIGLRKLKVFI
jgi:hypothetical protein